MGYIRNIIFVMLIMSIIFAPDLNAQRFGRNKVQYEDKDWQYIQSKHFDFYYYEGGQRLAEFAASVAESAYVSLNQLFNFKLAARIPIIIYRSHNDFSETNTSYGIQEESVGGFTEFLKNRVVIPFEGSYEKFRHVIHHELTHAVMLQFLYGPGPGAILSGISRMAPPLWFIEGLAEFTSIGWDTDSDMFVRDASIRGYLPPIQYLQAYLAYKGGQAVLLYLEENYGQHKLSELLQRMRTTRKFDEAWRSTLKEPLEETNTRWQRFMRQRYWPDIADRKEPSDYAQKLTDHVKWKNFVNNSPAVSPAGDRVAFLSDRSGYFDIYLVSATDPKKITKLVAGQRKADLEELQWLQPGMSWSPNGKFITFSSRSGRQDALNIIDVDKKEISTAYKFDLDAIYAPAWSPVKDEIAFVGVKKYQSDIYVYNLDTKKLTKVTDDIFSDMEPDWSPDGEQIAFVSDRKDFFDRESLQKEMKIENLDYHTTDIYLINSDGSGLQRLTNLNVNTSHPQWVPDGKRLLYVSDLNGISNIYYHDMTTGSDSVLTNLITGCAQLSWGLRSNRLAFTALSTGGYDIYIWPDPFNPKPNVTDLKPTVYVMQKQAQTPAVTMDALTEESDKVKELVKKDQNYSNFVFGRDFRRGIIDTREGEPGESILKKDEEIRENNGDFITNDYKVKFSVDNAGLNAGYDPIFGVYGLTEIYLSDVLGDHQIQIGANVIRDFNDSDLLLAYQNLKNRLNWAVSAYQFVNFYATNFGTARFINRGVGLYSFYPFSRYQRVNLGMQFFNIAEENLSFPILPRMSFSVLMPSISFSSDNSLWGYTGPARGGRNYIGFVFSPKMGSNGKEFVTGSFDFRKYIGFGRDYSLAFRVTGGASFGKNPTLFILGGIDNWLNYKFSDKIDAFTIPDYFLSDLMTPLRGARLYELIGSRAALVNMEFRFPFIQYLITRFPLPLGFQNIQGVGFFDAGTAWTEDKNWRLTARKANGDRYLRDITTGFGYGLRINLYFLLLRFDVAFRTDFDDISRPIHYYSIGLDF